MKRIVPLLMICGLLLSCMAAADMAAYRIGLKKLPSGGETRIGLKSMLGLRPLAAVVEETPGCSIYFEIASDKTEILAADFISGDPIITISLTGELCGNNVAWTITPSTGIAVDTVSQTNAQLQIQISGCESGGSGQIGIEASAGGESETLTIPVTCPVASECTLTAPSHYKELVASTSLEFAYAQGSYFYHLTLPEGEGYYHIHRYDKDLAALGLDLDIDMSGTATLDPFCLGATSTRYYVSAVGMRVWGDPPAQHSVSEIRIYRDDGTLYSQFGKKEYQDMWGAGGVIFALDEAGDRVYIYHQSEKKLYSTNLTGSDAISPKLSGVAVADISSYADKMCFYDGKLFIFDYYNQMVYIHDPSDGSRISSFSIAEEGDGDYDYSGMAVANDKIFISRAHDYDPPYEIKVFDLDGNYLGCIEMDTDTYAGYMEAGSDYVYNFSGGVAEAYDILEFGPVQ
ncbi:MAG: hypothetical protein WC769_01610 [Thermodesulfovibrionales bacterium]|jgi:hypothetical protein